jgi:undecaprenyl-diphosphatase
MRVASGDWWRLAALAAVVILFKAWFVQAAGLDLHFDEAQYWEWSRQLDWSYYSKGPLVAWLIALSEFLFGHGEWQVRLPAWLAHAGLTVMAYRFALDVWRDRAAAWWAAAIFVLTPLYFTLGLVMTTDIWLLLFWSWGLWACYRALAYDRPNAWLEAGIATGLGALTKLSIGLLPAFVGAAVLLSPRWRRHLASRRLWQGVGLMLLIMSPVIIWNSAHDWVMLRHEQGHVQHTGWSLDSVAEFLGGQLIALSPLTVAVMALKLGRRPGEAGKGLLWLLSLAWIAFFVLKSLGGKVQINWAAASYIGLLVLFAGSIPRLTRGQFRLLQAGLASGILLMAVAFFPYAFGMSGDRVPFRGARGWEIPIAALAGQAGAVDFILTDRYTLAAELAYYWPRQIHVYVTGDASRRYNQHDLWPGPEREAGRNGLWVAASPAVPELLEAAFDECREIPPVAVPAPDGSSLRTFYSRHCYRYQPVEWPRPSRY